MGGFGIATDVDFDFIEGREGCIAISFEEEEEFGFYLRFLGMIDYHVYAPPMVTEVSATFVDKMSFLIPGGDGLNASNC